VIERLREVFLPRAFVVKAIVDLFWTFLASSATLRLPIFDGNRLGILCFGEVLTEILPVVFPVWGEAHDISFDVDLPKPD
jgi:hypothetical protein